MAVLHVHSLTIRQSGITILDDLSFTVSAGEHWAIMGPSGSGKTSLLHALAGRHHYSGSITMGEAHTGTREKIVLAEQQHRFKNLSNTNTFYYQQRFNASDADDTLTVQEDIDACLARIGNDTGRDGKVEELMRVFGLHELVSAKLIQLSNGENKRLQIAKALLLQPGILLLDNPLTGLDAVARKTLADLLEGISRKGIHIIMVTGPGRIPDFITHVLYLEKREKCANYPIADFNKANLQLQHIASHDGDRELLKQLVLDAVEEDFENAFTMKGINIQYNGRKILEDIHWQVRKGEKWSLSGPNGAGKSTLLSLINADNPQAYANEIYLFDRRKGSGESIWDIKKKIGYVSPELHLYFDTAINCFEVVASGLFDTIGLFRALNERQEEQVMRWMKLLRIDPLRRTLLLRLSNSEQRLALLARALVKNPPLLILDEPCQGLDDDQVLSFKTLVDAICLLSNKTLIYVSHYPHEIPSCVNRFIRLEGGRVVVSQ